MILLSLLINI